MKIGILTFHWATNYGAILQAYALQEYLEGLGHKVEIINYKPKQFDNTILNLLRHPKMLLHMIDVKQEWEKEKCLQSWRKDHLHMTRRYYTTEEMKSIGSDYDMFVSGSDQILNPSFTLNGENHPTAAYFLTFADVHKQRVGYAVSFGCTSYPQDARFYASKWIASFDKIGVREQTGLDVLNEIGFNKKPVVVPDPTVLLGKRLFEKLDFEKKDDKDYTYIYMLRGRAVNTDYLNSANTDIVYADDDGRTSTMEKWISKIYNARQMITNSYHGMIMAILFHVPFVVLQETVSNTGMNDRFKTLLTALGLENRIVENNNRTITQAFKTSIDWEQTDNKVLSFAKIGESFFL